jgi:3-deoxy-manno-octulosonate cytidylyltransferase (CMP-KDO synthetase)
MADIHGKPMFWHVYQQALKANHLDQLIIATDDSRIFNAAHGYGFDVEMTSSTHSSGTDRLAEVIKRRDLNNRWAIINVQGDEPMIQPEAIDTLCAFMRRRYTPVATLVRKCQDGEHNNMNVVKCVFNNLSKKAIYFSRQAVPTGPDRYAHVGIYGYHRHYLLAFGNLHIGTLEKTENLEQLRWIENEIPIFVEKTNYISVGVDSPEDLEHVKRLIKACK